MESRLEVRRVREHEKISELHRHQHLRCLRRLRHLRQLMQQQLKQQPLHPQKSLSAVVPWVVNDIIMTLMVSFRHCSMLQLRATLRLRPESPIRFPQLVYPKIVEMLKQVKDMGQCMSVSKAP